MGAKDGMKRGWAACAFDGFPGSCFVHDHVFAIISIIIDFLRKAVAGFPINL